MRIDEIMQDRQPDQEPPRTLQELYDRQEDPEDQIHKDLRKLYSLEPNEKLLPCD